MSPPAIPAPAAVDGEGGGGEREGGEREGEREGEGDRDKESENRIEEEKSTYPPFLTPSLMLPYPLPSLTVFVHIQEPYTNAILM